METNDRTERLLALILVGQMKDASQRDKIHQLNLAGFSNLEIADVLETTAEVVASSLYQKRKTRPRRKRTSTP
jgi:hypothetical protein